MRPSQKYNADYFYNQAEKVLETTTNSEMESWYLHPCTEALLLLLEGDLANITFTWKNGGYTGSTADHTLQQNSKHIGMAMCIDTLMEHIRSMRRRDVEENT